MGLHSCPCCVVFRGTEAVGSTRRGSPARISGLPLPFLVQCIGFLIYIQNMEFGTVVIILFMFLQNDAQR